MLKAGDVIEGYLLGEKIGETGFYIQTWRATNAQGVDVVLKHHCTAVSDDYSCITHLTDQVAEMLPRLERLAALPPHPGIAPWTSCKFNPEQGYLLLCRPYYRERVGDRPPIPYAPQSIGMLDEIARGIDFLQDQRIDLGLLFPGNLLTDGLHGCFADFGLKALHDLIEMGYDGPRPGGSKLSLLFADLDLSLEIKGFVAKFAALYLYLRTGRLVFGNFACGPDSAFGEILRGLKEYRKTGKLCLNELSNPGERETVARALMGDKSRPFASCAEFMARIASEQ